MLVVLSPDSSSSNRDFTATFTSPLELTPHSRISLISANLPLDFTFTYNTDPTAGSNFTGNEFVISEQNPPNPAVPQTYTIPPFSGNIYQLLDAMNEQIITTPFHNKHTAYFSYDLESNVIVFNVVGDGTVATIDHQIRLSNGTLGLSCLPFLGFSALGGSNTISINGSGSAMFPSPPYVVSSKIGETINVAFPSLNIQTLFATGTLRNNNNVIHSIPFDIGKVPYNNTLLGVGIGGLLNMGVANYNYEPTHKEESEINNDGVMIINSLRVQLLDNSGSLSTLISKRTNDNKVVIVVNVETEKEKQNDVLRKVKDDKLFEKYSRNFVNYNP